MTMKVGDTASARALESVPGPRGFPLVGNALQIELSRLHAQLERWADAHGDCYAFRLGPTRCLVVSSEEAVRQAFADRPATFRRFHMMEEVARELGVHGLFSAEGEDWQRQRRLIMPAFREESLARAFPTLSAITARLVTLLSQKAEGGEPIDVLHVLMRYTVDVMAAVAFGRDMNTLERGPDELQRHFEVIFPMLLRRVNAPFPYWRYVKLAQDRALDAALAGARGILLPIVAQAKAELDAHVAKSADGEKAQAGSRTLLHAMLAASDEGASDGRARLSQDEVFANVLTLLLAGEDTTANTLAWMFYFLASDRAVQDEVAREAASVLGAGTTLARIGDAAKLPMLTAVAHETLRLKSPAPFVSLEAVTETVIADVRVPAGTPVFVLTRRLSTREPYFQDAASFRPSRFLASGTEGGRDKLRISLPFGAGPRVCPGRQLALLECVLALSAVVKQLHLSLPEGLVVRERFDFAMEPEGLRVTLAARH